MVLEFYFCDIIELIIDSVQGVTIISQEQEILCTVNSTICTGRENIKLPSNTVVGVTIWSIQSMKHDTLKKTQLVTNTMHF